MEDFMISQPIEMFRGTHTQPVNGLWSGTTQVGRYQKKHPLTPILIIGHPLSSSSIYNDQWHPLCSFYMLDSPLVQPLQVLFGLPLGLGPSTSYSIHFFTQSSSSFRRGTSPENRVVPTRLQRFYTTGKYHRPLVCVSSEQQSLN